MDAKPQACQQSSGINAPQPSWEELRELHTQAMEKSKEGKTPTVIKAQVFLLYTSILQLNHTCFSS